MGGVRGCVRRVEESGEKAVFSAMRIAAEEERVHR